MDGGRIWLWCGGVGRGMKKERGEAKTVSNVRGWRESERLVNGGGREVG